MQNEQELLKRITLDPQKLAGKPTIRGRRMSVEQVLGMLAAGETAENLLKEYPWMEPEDISACLLYAEKIVGSVEVTLEPAEVLTS